MRQKGALKRRNGENSLLCNVIEDDRNETPELPQERNGDFSHLWMRPFRTTEFEEVPPLPKIVGDDDFGL